MVIFEKNTLLYYYFIIMDLLIIRGLILIFPSALLKLCISINNTMINKKLYSCCKMSVTLYSSDLLFNNSFKILLPTKTFYLQLFVLLCSVYFQLLSLRTTWLPQATTLTLQSSIFIRLYFQHPRIRNLI